MAQADQRLEIPDPAPVAALADALAAVTEAAAVAAADWIGRGCKDSGDGAAVAAMREAFRQLPATATVVIGEGEKDDAPMLYSGEVLGCGGPALDLAVDPVEGTSLLAAGMPGAVSVLAAAPAGSLFRPGPSFYMDKLVVPPVAAGAVDPEAPTPRRLEQLAAALDRPVSELRVFVLDKPRHKTLVAEIRAAGARVCLAPAGDVLGGLTAALGEDMDALMGVGGTPEGVITACIARALGAGMWGRLAPQGEAEARRVRDEGRDTAALLDLERLVSSRDVVAALTGITGGPMLSAARVDGGARQVETLVIRGAPPALQRSSSRHFPIGH